jgi:hypothetical protein
MNGLVRHRFGPAQAEVVAASSIFLKARLRAADDDTTVTGEPVSPPG